MPATGVFAEAQAALAANLTALGIVVVTDPRNARPMSVLIEPPSFTSFTYNVAKLTFTLRVLSSPPGNQDAVDYLYTTIDQIINTPTIDVLEGRPSLSTIGGQDIPSYDLTVAVATRRN